MNYRIKMIFPAIGMLLLFGIVVFAVSGSRDVKQPLPPALNDLASIKTVEIKDAGGQVVLNGNFTTWTERDGDLKGKARLNSTNVIANARGEAEFEVSRERNGFIEKDLDVEVDDLAADTTYNLIIDGRQITSFSTNRRGDAELEFNNRASR